MKRDLDPDGEPSRPPDREQSRWERRRERGDARLMRHQERHRRHEEHLRRYWLAHHLNHPRGIRHYIGAHMHRRIFMWFGASIFLTGAMVSAVAHITGGRGPVRGVRWVLPGRRR